MKKRLLAVFIAAFMAFAFTGWGGSDVESSTTDTASQENTDTASESSSTGTSSDLSQISQAEIDTLSDSQFYVANSTGGEIKELYVSESGTENWGNNLLSSAVSDGQKVIVSASGAEKGKQYDIRVVDGESNTVEYYNFDIVSTVQITFHENAQCDVSTI